jgi:hypothetical protein
MKSGILKNEFHFPVLLSDVGNDPGNSFPCFWHQPSSRFHKYSSACQARPQTPSQAPNILKIYLFLVDQREQRQHRQRAGEETEATPS